MKAKKCIRCKEIKKLIDFHKHKLMKDGRLNVCKKCHSKYGKKYYQANKKALDKSNKKYRENNKERISELIGVWQKNNPSKCSANSKKYKAANKERVSKANKIYNEKNKEKQKEGRKIYYAKNKKKIAFRKKEWCKLNQGKRIASVAKRRAAKLSATPQWANFDMIKSYYEFSAFLTSTTFGNGYHVDHIIPLQGKTVCGLHVENNLQVLRAEDNLSKGHKLI